MHLRHLIVNPTGRAAAGYPKHPHHRFGTQGGTLTIACQFMEKTAKLTTVVRGRRFDPEKPPQLEAASSTES